jgi:PAS domain S-box-containing protein
MGALIDAHDWAGTALGDPSRWPPSLRVALPICLATQSVGALYWGPDFVVLYNDAYALALGNRHPFALGRPLREVWPEIWDVLSVQVQSVIDSGRGFTTEHQPLTMLRHGKPEETYWVYSFAPVFEEDGSVAGCYVTALETTQQILAERGRAATVASLAHSEEQLRLATEAAEVGLWDVDVLTDTLYWPPRVKAMFGISPDVSVSMADFYAGLHPEDAPETGAAYARAADPERRALYDVEYRTIGKEDGVIRWVAAKGRGVFDEHDKCIRVIGTAIDITRRKADEEQLRRLNANLENEISARIAERDQLWRSSQDIFVVVDAEGVIQAVNPAAMKILGYTADEMLGQAVFAFVHPDDRQLTLEALIHSRTADLPIFENRYRHKDDSYRVISWVATPQGGLIYASGRHVTEERRRDVELAEALERLRQSQKMEAVGQLTGGIAHDFNNLLAGITGSLELLQRRVATGQIEGLQRYTSTAITSAQRAAALTQRLLAFARRQPLDPKRVDANRLVAEMEDLLRRTLGPSIDLEMVMSGGLWWTLCDPNQLESAILNLAINGRDAMPEGGRLTIETANAHLDDAYARAQGDELRAGQYVAIAVTDTGIGMPPDIIAKVFDPFFTTKPLGQGTGLGLSMLYGFIKQSEGHVKIYSEVGKGTTFKLYLPRLREELGADSSDSAVLEQLRQFNAEQGETVLVVDDEAAVRMLVTETLQELGYKAIEAAESKAALRVIESDVRIDLLVTDVGIPGLNGRQIADAARVLRPDLKVLFMTGYAHNAAVGNSAALEPGMRIITKPFSLDALAQTMREMIEGN